MHKLINLFKLFKSLDIAAAAAFQGTTLGEPLWISSISFEFPNAAQFGKM